MSEHVMPKKMYFFVFAALIALTLITTVVATFNLGPLNIVAALLIALCKASLVVLFFMHLKWSTRLTRIVAVAALFWLVLLIALTLSDYTTRPWTPNPQTWESSSGQ